MKIKKLILGMGGVTLLSLGMMSNAHAIDTLVQYSTDGTGDGTTNGPATPGYDVVAINEFDWQSSGDLVITDVVDSGGTSHANFQTFVSTFITSSIGTTIGIAGDGVLLGLAGTGVEYDIHAHARLNDMLDNSGGSVAPVTLDANGAAGGDTGFEVTAALSGHETSSFLLTINDANDNGIFDAGETFTQTLSFLTISGSFEWFHDDTPDSDVETGLGFVNGTSIASGDITGVSGATTVDANGVFSGNTVLANDITSYNSAYIQTDPSANNPLTGATFDTLITLISSGEAAAGDAGDTIGLDPYTVVAGDLALKADANSEFTATPNQVPEPQALLLISLGLIGLGATKKRNKKES